MPVLTYGQPLMKSITYMYSLTIIRDLISKLHESFILNVRTKKCCWFNIVLLACDMEQMPTIKGGTVQVILD